MDKYQHELEFWRQELRNYIDWYDGKILSHYDTPCPTEEQKVKVDTKENSAVLTWMELHQKPKYLEYLKLTPESLRGKIVLDIGSGPMPSATCFNGAMVYSLDPLFHQYREAGFSLPWIDTKSIPLCCKAEEMTGVPDNFFDAVIAVNALDHVDDLPAVVKEIQRVLKPGGILRMHVHYHQPAPTEPITLTDEVMRDAFSWCEGFHPIARTNRIRGYQAPEGEQYVLWSNKEAVEPLLISVLMSVWKTPLEFVKQAVESILHQSTHEFSFIIVDDNNQKGELTDYLYNIRDHECCLQVVRHSENKGLAAALDFGLKHCPGNLIVRMDSDDIASPDLVQKHYDYFTAHPEVAICGVRIKLISNTREWHSRHPDVVTKEVAYNDDSYWFINHPGVAFRREVIQACGGYGDTPTHLAEDYALWIKLLKQGYIIHNVQDVLMDYRVHATSFTGNQNRQSQQWLDFLKQQKQSLYE